MTSNWSSPSVHVDTMAPNSPAALDCNSPDAAQLIVIKHVINDNGGTAVAADFTLDFGGVNDTPDDFPGAEAPGTTVTLDAGAYNVTETGPTGYTASYSADCTGTIAEGETKTCTVTNDDQPATVITLTDLAAGSEVASRIGVTESWLLLLVGLAALVLGFRVWQWRKG